MVMTGKIHNPATTAMQDQEAHIKTGKLRNKQVQQIFSTGAEGTTKIHPTAEGTDGDFPEHVLTFSIDCYLVCLYNGYL